MEEGRQKKFLHGTLEISIFDSTPYKPPFALNLCLCRKERSTTYVSIEIDKKKVAKTTSDKKQLIWNQSFQIPCAHPSTSIITITMKTNFSILGNIQIPAQRILDQNETLINGFFPITNIVTGKPHPSLKLRFMLWFKPADLEPGWETLLENGEYKGVKNSWFPKRSNCDVRLYQDAHHSLGFQPFFRSPRKLFEDVYKAIEDAKHLIYIAGWSFNPKMVLVRDSQTDIPHAIGVKLGDLLKRKADDDGVVVRIMVWDDETSLPFIKNKGIMGTRDKEAIAYFKKTKVVCMSCPRLHNDFPTFFTHHQKTITVDSRTSFSSSNREIMSFVGGLDLCDGRYDTEEHSLFRTLNTDRYDDFYQTSIAGANLDKGGPREPWHDTHACIIGEAAWDILRNFEQRWNYKEFNRLPEASGFSNLHPPQYYSSNERDWNVQVFRSIDHLSVVEIPTVERSIHEAYVEAIRRAERFIYIENQYFIGGCHLWRNEDQHSGCENLIPIEIALKVARKIRANERFGVYIIIPMWPEGTPESESVQEILHWTRETMIMIYKIIGDAIKETGTSSHPKDYLNFFCLANREEKRDGEFIPTHFPHSRSSSYWKAQTNRRFMVYVHSKLMIVDDTYMLIGSANINQRSMDGQRDTEIAIGCYQVNKEGVSAKKLGDIHEFRMSLWYEHTRFTQESLKEPESMECVELVRSLGEKMWELYKGDKVVDMDGVHLVAYPISVQKYGYIDEEEEDTCFPDTKALIMGKRSKLLPTMATT